MEKWSNSNQKQQSGFFFNKGLQCCFLSPKFPQSFTLAFHSHSTIKRAHKKHFKVHWHSSYSLKATETAEIIALDWSLTSKYFRWGLLPPSILKNSQHFYCRSDLFIHLYLQSRKYLVWIKSPKCIVYFLVRVSRHPQYHRKSLEDLKMFLTKLVFHNLRNIIACL